MRRLFAAALAAGLAVPAAAGDFSGGVVVSSAAQAGRAASGGIEWKLGYREPLSPAERPAVGIGVGVPEGRTLECSLWGAGGAVVGALAGPLGAAIGGGIGVLAGFVVARLFTPTAHPRRAAALQ